MEISIHDNCTGLKCFFFCSLGAFSLILLILYQLCVIVYQGLFQKWGSTNWVNKWNDQTLRWWTLCVSAVKLDVSTRRSEETRGKQQIIRLTVCFLPTEKIVKKGKKDKKGKKSVSTQLFMQWFIIFSPSELMFYPVSTVCLSVVTFVLSSSRSSPQTANLRRWTTWPSKTLQENR